MEIADDDPFQTDPVRQDQGRHAHLARGEAAGQQLEALDLQMEAAKAVLNGEAFIRRAMGWLDNPETGERVRKEVPVRFRRWFWKDEQGSYMLDVHYGNRRLEIESKKPAIEVGEAKNLIPTSAASY